MKPASHHIFYDIPGTSASAARKKYFIFRNMEHTTSLLNEKIILIITRVSKPRRECKDVNSLRVYALWGWRAHPRPICPRRKRSEMHVKWLVLWKCKLCGRNARGIKTEGDLYYVDDAYAHNYRDYLEENITERKNTTMSFPKQSPILINRPCSLSAAWQSSRFYPNMHLK